MDVETVTTIAKSLRKIYAITKQNMDLLDKAIVQSFIEKFPNDSSKIGLGNVGLKMLLNEKHQSSKGRITKARKGKHVSSKKGVKDIIILKGQPIYAELKDINDNIESQDCKNVKQYKVPSSDSLCTAFNTHLPAVKESDSDWSDIDITC